MFRDEGTARTDRQNRRVTGALALVAGCVNSAGFVLIGSFTSHVTGNVGRFANDLALGDRPAAISAALLVVTFFVGAFLASVAIESHPLRRPPATYGFLLLTEAALLGIFVVLAATFAPSDPRAHDALAALLCLAMGLQNALVTRLSGAVVRTTHLTGAVTDLGVEAARWFRHWRASVQRRTGVPLVFRRHEREPPNAAKSVLLLTLVGAFILGSAGGAAAAVRFGPRALLGPVLALVALGAYAFSHPDVPGEDRSPG